MYLVSHNLVTHLANISYLNNQRAKKCQGMLEFPFKLFLVVTPLLSHRNKEILSVLTKFMINIRKTVKIVINLVNHVNIDD